MRSSPPCSARRIVLVGMMGAGKSTVGRALAAKRGWGFLDSDAEIEARTGHTVAEIWEAQGEPAFRRLEAQVLADALAADQPCVVAAAGGVVLDADNRRRLRGAGPVVWLRARPETLARRVGAGNHRPLLADDPAGVLARMAEERAGLYAEVADVSVDVDGLSPEQVVAAVEQGLSRSGDGSRPQEPETVTRTGGVGVEADGGLARVTVGLGERSYPVLVGPGARHRLLEVLPVGARRAAVVTQEAVGVTVDPGIESTTFLVGDGEAAKCLEAVEDLCRGFARLGLTRTDVVVAVGGGMVTDTAGLAAALYHRGVAVVHVATTLIGQVDAAIGGKTAVNLPEGKNLVGAFWQPAAVLCDTEVLETLPPAEYRSGLGEMAKYHFLTDEDLGDLPLAEKVARCVALKASFVSADEREDPAILGPARGGEAARSERPAAGQGPPPLGGGRGWGPARGGEAARSERPAAGQGPPPLGGGRGWGPARGGEAARSRVLLNYGHTLGHALETAGHYGLRHGEAVAVGLVFAARLARRLGRIGDDRVAEHVAIVAGYGLPTTVPAGTDGAELIGLMAHDKKALDGFTFVLDGPRGLEVVTGVARADLEATLAEMEATPS